MSNKLPTIVEHDEQSKTYISQSKSGSVSTNKSSRVKVEGSAGKNSQSNDATLSRTKSGSKTSIKNPLPEPKPLPINHMKDKNISLMEDTFGIYNDETGKPCKVQRFTWKNCNNVQVQIITYGARITSIKIPDRKGIIDDIVLGFSDLAGYLYYGDYYFGATIGPVADKIKGATFQLEDKIYKISNNSNNDYVDGGFHGLDKVLWNSYVNESKVILSCTLPNKHEGFPGPVMFKITFELLHSNEFRIEIEANAAKPTLVNLSNLCFFNLGGHYSGPEEIYNHSILINANCYTLMDEDNLPTGEIMNIVHTKYDFLSPKLLKNYLDIEPDDGYDQNLCINRSTSQKLCFVARAVHALNGRVLEIYSNQYSVRFITANNWGLGMLPIPLSSDKEISSDLSQKSDYGIFYLLNRLHEKMEEIEVYDEVTFTEVHNLLKKINKIGRFMPEEDNMHKLSFVNPDHNALDFVHILEESMVQIRETLPLNIDDITDWNELKQVVDDLLARYGDLDNPENSQFDEFGSFFDEDKWTADSKQRFEEVKKPESNDHSIHKPKSNQSVSKSRQLILEKMESSRQSLNEKYQQAMEKDAENDVASEAVLTQPSMKSIGNVRSSSLLKKSSLEIMEIKSSPKLNNEISRIYQDGRIHGKNNAIYKRHGAIAFQTQNYPDAIHHSNFPCPILRPGHTYKHTIVYKFWVKDNGLSNLRIKRRCR